MARNVYRFRRLKWGDPERKLQVLTEDIGSGARQGPARRRRPLTIPQMLIGLLIVSAFGVGYTWDTVSSANIAALLPTSSCTIKGNISIETGERIYHVPGQQYYDATRISRQHGERWFCSEAEARKAGWRKARTR